jgi:hypothetical protein
MWSLTSTNPTMPKTKSNVPRVTRSQLILRVLSLGVLVSDICSISFNTTETILAA